MQFLKNIPTKFKIIIGVVTLAIIVFVFFKSGITGQEDVYKVVKQPFQVQVTAEGEVMALKYENIEVPGLLNRRDLRIWHLKITDLVTEGKQVKKGDFIAKLDPSDVEDRLKQRLERIDERSNELEAAILDSTITLVEKRDAIVNNRDDLEEAKIQLEQSVYESKATQRKAQINYDKVRLNLNKEIRNYEKEVQRQKSRIAWRRKRLDEDVKIKDMLEELKVQLNVTSPSDGMVVYGRNWRGRKIKVNDEVGPWSPVIATIPDLSSLISEAIVKEIDIAKIKIGQTVQLTIDAFPNEVFNGKVMKIANVGQPIKGTGMNGFKVVIEMNKSDKKVLPGMTTYNLITVGNYAEDIAIPREAVFGSDTSKYVYLKKFGKPEKRKVQTGEENDTHIRILSGLEEGDELLLSNPLASNN